MNRVPRVACISFSSTFKFRLKEKLPNSLYHPHCFTGKMFDGQREEKVPQLKADDSCDDKASNFFTTAI